MRFDLNSPSLAQYQWGTLFCRFSAAAPVKKETFIKILAALIEGVAPWQNDEEFLATVAFLHEIVHLAQDLTTGLGHSDYLVQRISTNGLLYYASVVVQLGGPSERPPYNKPGSDPWFDDEQDPFVAEVQDQLRYSPFAMTPRKRLERFRALMQKDLKRTIDNESLFDFSTQSILECDAALMVLLNLRELRASKPQIEIQNRNSALLDREKLGPEYWKPSWHLQAVLRHHAELDDNQLQLVVPKIFGLFIDSALACPPLEWIQARDQSPDDFDPGIKYGRLLIAFQNLSGATMEQFWHALFKNRSAEAEAILLAQASFPYPSSEKIYQVWIETLAPSLSESIVAELRHTACRYRLDKGGLRLHRGIGLLVDMQAPILYLHKEHGFVKHDWGMRAVDNEKSHRMTLELVDHFMDMELVDFLFRTGEFRCPHAQADICPVVEDRCMSGFVHLAQIPESPKCIARSTLIHCGVNLPTE